ncbi:MAG: carboxypeptidase M32 [Anaerolineae bacterium]|nr:carboxypeptidase M32 [Phycisphaerae bacterium]
MTNSNQSNAPYEQLVKQLQEIAVLESTLAVLGWDERVNMPPGCTEGRAEQLSYLARLHHEHFTSPKIGELLSKVESTDVMKGDPRSDAAVNVRETRRAFDRATKLPGALVEEMARTSSLGEAAWIDARKKSDFKAFEPWLAKQVDLKRQQAKCYGYKEHIYDALLDDYEPHATTSQVKGVFDAFRPKLVEIIRRVTESGKKAPKEILRRHFPQAAQYEFGKQSAAAIGFDFEKGRLDVSVHPFCTGMGRGDTRMTTRYDEHDMVGAFFGVLHESGHGLYDQGLDEKHWGLPRGKAVSLGIHESQSRMWENFVGRSKSFWKFMMPKARAAFDCLKDVKEEDFVFAVNDIRPSLIRTESDEATYNLHIMLRFDLEQQMLVGDLKPADVPAAWNERMKKDFGITPPDDAKGCLQDTHWSSGLMGYFPTYALGNMYCAQFFEKARQDLGDLDAMFAKGDFKPLLDWLRKNVHRHGMTYTPRQLVKHVTGSDLSPEPLLRHLSKKASEYYGV